MEDQISHKKRIYVIKSSKASKMTPNNEFNSKRRNDESIKGF
jgi:hypothetical protein